MLGFKLMKTFKGRHLYRHEIESYVYNSSLYICDFGWKLSNKASYWNLYAIWSNLSTYQSKPRIKREYFINAISSEAGATAFVKYYKQNTYYLTYYKGYAWSDIMSDGGQKVQDFAVPILFKYIFILEFYQPICQNQISEIFG